MYGEVAGFEALHLAELGRFHQLMVDTYAAQHVGERTPAMSAAFALIGLHLALELGMTGIEVRNCHQYLARHFREWPRYERSSDTGSLTVMDVAKAHSVRARSELMVGWAAAVWSSWRPVHQLVSALTAERLSLDRRTVSP